MADPLTLDVDDILNGRGGVDTLELSFNSLSWTDLTLPESDNFSNFETVILDLEQMDYSIASSPNLDFSSYDSLRRIEMKNGTSIDGRAIDFMLGLQQDLVLENIRDADIDNDALNDGGIS